MVLPSGLKTTGNRDWMVGVPASPAGFLPSGLEATLLPGPSGCARVRSRAGGDVPDPDGGLAAAGRGQGLPVGAEGDFTEVVGVVILKRMDHRAGGDIPQLYSPICAGGGEELAVPGNRQLPDRLRVSPKGTDGLAGGSVPQGGHLVPAGRSQPGPVRVKDDRVRRRGRASS